MSLNNKNCLITGANTGLGFAVAKKFASLGANTILVCRDKEKGKSAINEIKNEISGASVEYLICDLSSMKSIHSFIEEFKKKYSKLDILYNNAAVMKQNRTVTKDGFEIMFQVNYLGPFIIMNAFLYLLKNGSEPMIINNGRPADKYRIDLDDLQFEKSYNMYHSFFKTKLCLLFASLELSQRQESDGITITMIDPGPFKSSLVRDVPIMGWFKNLFSASVDKAADNILYHIISDDAKNKNGKVFKEKQEKSLIEYWKDKNVSERLWSITESLINQTSST
jgi:NAD(P)-dependent dehydrogenase (short-subunit alcohol dehydrogenase family)